MTQVILTQLLDTVDQGIIVFDRNTRITFFNQWLALNSGIDPEQALGMPLFELLPTLGTPLFQRNLRSVFSIGNTAYFSHNATPWLIPLPPPPSSAKNFDHMQQSGQMGPLREDGEIRFAYLIIRDVTETVTDVQRLTRMAMHDALTGAWNRRWFDHWLTEEVGRAGRYSRELTLLMFDLDHFKRVNDTHGHQAGDEVLAAVSACCTNIIRTTDTLARYGGEEFCVMLPETGREAALILAERLRAGVEKLEIMTANLSLRVTISLGVACFSPGMGDQALLHAADQALYQAKEGGRNRVVGDDFRQHDVLNG
jgi:diguanylate cyclase (GGDEF)-like protein